MSKLFFLALEYVDSKVSNSIQSSASINDKYSPLTYLMPVFLAKP